MVLDTEEHSSRHEPSCMYSTTGQHFDILSFKMPSSTHTVYSISVATSHTKDAMAAHLRSVRPLSFNLSICVSLVF